MRDIVLLHGAIGAKDQLESLAGELKDKYAVHLLNFSGHGGRAFPGAPFSIPYFAGNVLDHLQQHNIQRSAIFGYSMGGYVAMYLARHYPHAISRIITLATKFYWDEAVAAKEINMLDADKITEKLPAFAKQLEQRHAPNDWKTVLDKTKEMLLQLGLNNTLQLEDYTKISTPCLLLLGDKDRMITVDETIAVQRALPHSEFKLLPGVPHPVEQVDTRMLSSLIDEFLEQPAGQQ